MEKSIILECLCGHAIIKLITDEDSTNFAFYSHAESSLWSRLKKAWKREQTLLEDIEISTEELDRLGRYAVKNSLSETSSTGYKGIYIRNDRKNKYCVEVKMATNTEGDQHTHYVGNFQTLEEAVTARKEYILGLL